MNGLLYSRIVLPIGLLALAAAVGSSADQPAKVALRIGTTEVLLQNAEKGGEETAKDTFRDFIKAETGFTNKIIQVDNYQVLLEQMEGGKLDLGVFEGFEFAWAQARQPKLKVLLLGVNKYPYHYAHLLVAKDSKAADFAGLKGATLALPRLGLPNMRLFVDQQSKTAGAKGAEDFFGKLTTLDNIEAVLDEVVDGKVQAAVVDRVGLEAYQRRKPGRYGQLKELLKSDALLPALVAYYEGKVPAATLQRFRDGLVNAHKKKSGQRLLDQYRLTSFQTPAGDFERVLAETLKKYPPRPVKATQRDG